MIFTSRKKLKKAEEQLARLIKEIDVLKDRPFCLGVKRAGRVNKFLFVRGGEMFEIETMGLLGDKVEEWNEKLTE